jgi:uncharacterized membrane protein
MLFPGREDLHMPERIGFSIGLSFAVVSFIGLGLNYAPVAITRFSFVISLALFSVIVGFVVLYRRSRLTLKERFILQPGIWLQWLGKARPNKAMLMFSVMAILLLVGGAIAMVLAPRSGETFTEFYVLGADGQFMESHSMVTRDQPVNVILGIINHERGDVRYRLELEGGVGQEQIATVQLHSGESWQQSYTFTLDEVGVNHEITFVLYRGDELEPYRLLHLWATVRNR